MKKLQLIVILVLLSTSVTAMEFSDDIQSEINLHKSEIIGFELPSVLSTLFTTERININIQDSTNFEIVGIIIENKIITDIKYEPLEDPTLNAYITKDKIIKLANSEDPVLALLSALENKEITYQATNIFDKIKLWFINLGLWIIT